MSTKIKKGLFKARINGEMKDIAALVAGGGGGGGGSYDDTEIRSMISQKYSKPETGIPESDLSEDVQTKLNSGGGEDSTDYKVIETINVEESVGSISVDFEKPLKKIFVCFNAAVGTTASGLIFLYDESTFATYGYITQLVHTVQKVTNFEATILPACVHAMWYSVTTASYPSANTNVQGGITRYFTKLDKITKLRIDCAGIHVGSVITIMGVEK